MTAPPLRAGTPAQLRVPLAAIVSVNAMVFGAGAAVMAALMQNGSVPGKVTAGRGWGSSATRGRALGHEGLGAGRGEMSGPPRVALRASCWQQRGCHCSVAHPGATAHCSSAAIILKHSRLLHPTGGLLIWQDMLTVQSAAVAPTASSTSAAASSRSPRPARAMACGPLKVGGLAEGSTKERGVTKEAQAQVASHNAVTVQQCCEGARLCARFTPNAAAPLHGPRRFSGCKRPSCRAKAPALRPSAGANTHVARHGANFGACPYSRRPRLHYNHANNFQGAWVARLPGCGRAMVERGEWNAGQPGMQGNRVRDTRQKHGSGWSWLGAARGPERICCLHGLTGTASCPPPRVRPEVGTLVLWT
jgi:hypothetical protein